MKTIFKILAVALVAITAASCSKDDGGGNTQPTKPVAEFVVSVPQFVYQQNLIPVTLSVECDVAPMVRFVARGEELGVVSMTKHVQMGVDYIYAGESIPVVFADGRATATFWYVPLSHGDHRVKFEVGYRQGGEQRSDVCDQTFEVANSDKGGFYPEVVATDSGFRFRNEVGKGREGCSIYMRFGDINGDADPSTMNIDIGLGKDPWKQLVADTFYNIQPQKWSQSQNKWVGNDGIVIRNNLVDPITMKLIFCDDFNRCRDVVVKMDENRNIISSIAGNYYLLHTSN